MPALGKTLFVVNPAAKNGTGMNAVPIIEATCKANNLDYAIEYTQHEKHGFDIAHTAEGFDTIVSVGGDGNAHDVANGILSRDVANRPAFSLIPMGSGNDYARTLAIPFGVDNAIRSLFDAKRCRIDCGICNGTYFLESVSFGIDAAIAIGTIELRKKTGGSGTSLYMQSGFDVIRNHYQSYRLKMATDGGIASAKDYLIFCVTIGKTYGGGFIINPDATAQSGLLNLCVATPMPRLKALGVFVLASKGMHTRFKAISFDKIHKAVVDYKETPPTQFDGEPQSGTHFELEVIPRGLEVVVPEASPLKYDY